MEHPDETIIARLMEKLEERNITAYYAPNRHEALEIVKKLLPEGCSVAAGGSVTLEEIGAIDYVKTGNFTYFDRSRPGMTPEEKKRVTRAGLTADVFLTGTNAITEDGKLFNIDGAGSRVGPMIFGPDSVIVVAGINKIAGSDEEAVGRTRNVAAPKNTVRLHKKTPCVALGRCADCASDDRICNEFVWIVRQREKGRMKVVLVGEPLGY